MMDIEMPIMNGIKATKRLNRLMNQNKIPDIPIVALSAYLDEKEKCEEVGMFEFSNFLFL